MPWRGIIVWMVELEGREGEVVVKVKSTLASERKLYREKGFKFQVFTTLRIRI